MKGGSNIKQVDEEIVRLFYKKDGKILVKKFDSTVNFTNFLKKENMFKKKEETFYVFDLHNVLDLLPLDYLINRNDKSKIICCSYVGKNSEFRELAYQELQKRIKSGQIDWGVTIYKRAKKRKKENPFKFHSEGSKAWFCKLIKADYFFDDALDHVKSVESLKKGPIVEQIFNRDQLMDEIYKILFNQKNYIQK